MGSVQDPVGFLSTNRTWFQRSVTFLIHIYQILSSSPDQHFFPTVIRTVIIQQAAQWMEAGKSLTVLHLVCAILWRQICPL